MEQSVNVEVNKSLEKKKKAELIEIIFRKDAVELALRKDLKRTTTSLNDVIAQNEVLKETNTILDKKYKDVVAVKDILQEKYDEINNNFTEQCDQNITDYNEYKEKLTGHKVHNAILYLVILILIMIIIL